MAGSPYDVIFCLSRLNLSIGTHEIMVKARAEGYMDSPASNTVSYTLVQVSGTWYFNPTILLSKTIEQYVDFSCDGDTYRRIRIIYVNSSRSDIQFTGKNDLSGTDSKETVYESRYDASIGGIIETWASQAYRTITFVGVQTVTKEFYDWLVENAVQQTIGFTIDGTQYFADVGMTWDTWVQLNYNTDGYIVTNSELIRRYDFDENSSYTIYKVPGSPVKANEIIEANYAYINSKEPIAPD